MRSSVWRNSKSKPGLGKKWPVTSYWRQPGHWPSSQSSDHRHQDTGGSPLPGTLACRAPHCSPHSVLQLPVTSTTKNEEDLKNDARQEVVRKKSKVNYFVTIDCWYKSILVSGLTILITMKYLLGVRRALLSLRWPCFPTLYNTSLVGLVLFIFSTTTRYNPHAMNRG